MNSVYVYSASWVGYRLSVYTIQVLPGGDDAQLQMLSSLSLLSLARWLAWRINASPVAAATVTAIADRRCQGSVEIPAKRSPETSPKVAQLFVSSKVIVINSNYIYVFK